MSNGPVQSKQIDDLLAFPVLTQDVGTAGTSRPSGTSAAPGSAPLAQIVENTLRNVLGWRPRMGDSKGFMAALQQSFTCKDVEGHMECRWTPRGAAIGIQADLGAITGAQASLYARARNTLDQVLPLLDGLRSLLSDSDAEDNQSARTIVRTTLAELVDETGRLGGPRVLRVDELFLLLLGPSPDPAHPENVGGHLQLLRDRFGLSPGLVGTVDEERVLTDFLLVVDYVSGLQQAWTTQRTAFLRGNSAFLGTQLVLLSRELAVAGESVQELYSALDSVFVGAAERETVVLEFGGGQPPLTVAELFSWVERFVSFEGPRLLQDAGKDGVTAFRSTLTRLEDLVEEASAISRRDSSNPVSGYHTIRVANQIDGLLATLRRARKLSAAVGRIAVEEVFPPVGRPGTTTTVAISGHGFETGAAVSFGPGITVDQVKRVDAEHLEVTLTIPNGAPAAPYSITVSNPQGRGTVTLPEAFRIDPKAAKQDQDPRDTDRNPPHRRRSPARQRHPSGRPE